MKTIQNLHRSERPREKLMVQGAASLTDCELLAILLGSGSKGNGVNLLAQDVLRLVDGCNGVIDASELIKLHGIGTAKASLIAAALEFARRRIRPSGVRVQCAADVLPLVRHWADRKQEYFLAISLNGAHEVIATRVVTVGLVNAAQIHPREVFCDPIKDRACAVVVAHNHPSGRLEPSPEDIAVTKMLSRAGKTIGLALLDHVIFALSGYFSFQESRTRDLVVNS